MKNLIFGLILACGVVGQANALVYTEGPDLNVSNENLGVLSLGLNTVSGSLSGNCQGVDLFGNGNLINQCFGDSQDPLFVELDAGQQLDSVSLLFSNVSAPTGLELGIEGLQIDDLFSVDFSSALMPLINDATSLFGYNFTITTDRFPSVVGAFSADYELSILTSEVATVPVPATAWLFVSALFSLIGLRAKRR